MTQIRLENYNPQWKTNFETLREVYETVLGKWIIEVQHVGSTAVEGLLAKPILDIDIIVESSKKLPYIIEKLVALGYNYQGDLGITGREAFKQVADDVPKTELARTWQKHHLYVCLKDSISLKNHLALRDYLKQNPVKVQEYSELKQKIIVTNPTKEDYTKQKTHFILSILAELDFDTQAIEHIKRQN